MNETRLILFCLNCSVAIKDVAGIVFGLGEAVLIDCPGCREEADLIVYVEQERKIPVRTVEDLKKVIGEFTPLPGEAWH